MLRSAGDLLKLARTTRSNLFSFNLDNVDVLRHLRFEEFLYRNVTPLAPNSAFLLTNNYSREGSVVFGLSGDPAHFISDFNRCKSLGIQLIRRFTGGGTVLIDDHAILSSLIITHGFALSLSNSFSSSSSSSGANYGTPVGIGSLSKWAYDKVYSRCSLFGPQFKLMDNDYVITPTITTTASSAPNTTTTSSSEGTSYYKDQPLEAVGSSVSKKIGGNAQAFSKHAFVHHTSFIWSVSPLINELLLLPKKRPEYRGDRAHEEFLTSITTSCPLPVGSTTVGNSKVDFVNRLRNEIVTLLPNEHVYHITTGTDRSMDSTFGMGMDFIDDCIKILKSSNTSLIVY